MRYQIKRQAYNEKTFNGFEDNPYWEIQFNQYHLGVTNKGKLFGIKPIPDSALPFVKLRVNEILKECLIDLKI